MQFKKYLTAIFSFVVFFGPMIAYVAGERSSPIENREAAQFNELSLNWDSLPTLGKFIGDRIPLRSHAIKLTVGLTKQYSMKTQLSEGVHHLELFMEKTDFFSFMMTLIWLIKVLR